VHGATLQAAREAVRTQILTLRAGIFAAGALLFTALNFRLSRRTFRLTETRVLSERFIAISTQLGDDKAAVRLAGVHAMAQLADDWGDNRQACIDVLCAYLRLNSDHDDPLTRLAANAIRTSAKKIKAWPPTAHSPGSSIGRSLAR
jgi:hypothetical protein